MWGIRRRVLYRMRVSGLVMCRITDANASPWPGSEFLRM